MKNAVTVFQGLLNYRLQVEVGTEPTTILLPFKKEHLCDAANIAVLGDDVEEISVSFPPTNAEDTTLDIPADEVFETLTTKLSGSSISVITHSKEEVRGTLIGSDNDLIIDAHGATIKKTYLSVLVTSAVVRRVSMTDVAQINFTDPEVQKEIAKSLAKNYQKIKPGSKYMTVVLKSKTNKKTTATLDYITPGAPWSAVYTLRRGKTGFTLDARGIVHNNTESDWSDYKIRLVSGSPGTFSTDVADQVTPIRKQVQIAPRAAVGGAEAKEGFSAPKGGRSAGMAPRMACVASAAESVGDVNYAKLSHYGNEDWTPTHKPEAQTGAEGDFVIYEPEGSVNIPANSVSPVHLFSKELSAAEGLLFYNYTDDPLYPWRAIKFTNELENGLSRGPCDVFLGNLAAGKCIIPNIKPGETRMLLHAQETGVRIEKTTEWKNAGTCTRININSGITLTEVSREMVTTYKIKNVRGEEFDLQMDHIRGLEKPSYDVSPDVKILESISNGIRLGIRLAARSEEVVTVVETQVESLKAEFTDYWLTSNLIAINHPSAKSKNLEEVISLREKIGAIQIEMQDLTAKSTVAEKDITRIRENAKIADGARKDAYLNAIDKTENIITDNTNRIATLHGQKQTLEKELVAALKKVSISWKG